MQDDRRSVSRSRKLEITRAIVTHSVTSLEMDCWAWTDLHYCCRAACPMEADGRWQGKRGKWMEPADSRIDGFPIW